MVLTSKKNCESVIARAMRDWLFSYRIPARDSFIPGILTVRIFRAENLPQMDAGGKADPYCVIKFAQYKMETKHIKKSCDPEWNEEFQIPYHVS